MTNPQSRQASRINTRLTENDPPKQREGGELSEKPEHELMWGGKQSPGFLSPASQAQAQQNLRQFLFSARSSRQDTQEQATKNGSPSQSAVSFGGNPPNVRFKDSHRNERGKRDESKSKSGNISPSDATTSTKVSLKQI